jgi:serine/threonine-protein kinase RsbT
VWQQPTVLAIRNQGDVEEARRAARALAEVLGFARADQEMIVLAVIELATNLLRYARDGVLTVGQVDGPVGVGIQLTSRDAGPGIADLDAALRDGFSTGGGRGDGLPAVRRLVDDFSIASDASGTRITACKWRATP